MGQGSPVGKVEKGKKFKVPTRHTVSAVRAKQYLLCEIFARWPKQESRDLKPCVPCRTEAHRIGHDTPYAHIQGKGLCDLRQCIYSFKSLMYHNEVHTKFCRIILCTARKQRHLASYSKPQEASYACTRNYVYLVCARSSRAC